MIVILYAWTCEPTQFLIPIKKKEKKKKNTVFDERTQIIKNCVCIIACNVLYIYIYIYIFFYEHAMCYMETK